jgi:hypothetical protein
MGGLIKPFATNEQTTHEEIRRTDELAQAILAGSPPMGASPRQDTGHDAAPHGDSTRIVRPTTLGSSRFVSRAQCRRLVALPTKWNISFAQPEHSFRMTSACAAVNPVSRDIFPPLTLALTTSAG